MAWVAILCRWCGRVVGSVDAPRRGWSILCRRGGPGWVGAMAVVCAWLPCVAWATGSRVMRHCSSEASGGMSMRRLREVVLADYAWCCEGGKVVCIVDMICKVGLAGTAVRRSQMFDATFCGPRAVVLCSMHGLQGAQIVRRCSSCARGEVGAAIPDPGVCLLRFWPLGVWSMRVGCFCGFSA